jgi:AcrR family transcriptional regulator
MVATAARRFAAVGYHATSLSDVVAGSGVTKGAMYFHFPNKESLADAVIAETDVVFAALLAEVEALGLDPLETLIVQTEQVMDRVVHNPITRGGVRLLNDAAVSSRHGGEHYRFAEESVLTRMRAAAASGLLREGVAVVVMARQVATLMAGHHLICERSGTLDELKSRVAAMWQALLPLIATDDWLTHHTGRICP